MEWGGAEWENQRIYVVGTDLIAHEVIARANSQFSGNRDMRFFGESPSLRYLYQESTLKDLVKPHGLPSMAYLEETTDADIARSEGQTAVEGIMAGFMGTEGLTPTLNEMEGVYSEIAKTAVDIPPIDARNPEFARDLLMQGDPRDLKIGKLIERKRKQVLAGLIMTQKIESPSDLRRRDVPEA
jgi:hypothetical protein